MDNSTLYKTAKELAEKIKQERSWCGELDAAVIVSGKEAYPGVTGVTLSGGKLTDVPADVAAFLNMRNAGGRTAEGLAVIKLSDMSVVSPSAEALELMFRTNTENDGCLVCLGESESKLLSALRLGADSGSMMDGFDFDEPETKTDTETDTAPESENVSRVSPAPARAEKAAASTTANVISGVAVDKENPFYESAADMAPPEETLSVMSEEQKAGALKNTAPQPELTPEQLLEQAKKRKQVAKSNFLFRKKHKE